jgi:hypothetical protein
MNDGLPANRLLKAKTATILSRQMPAFKAVGLVLNLTRDTVQPA